ncbi:hypothetical protein TrRE_jg13080 [Triparma retinervis]|uniref:glucose-6-phosphate 1-epimerase n=1 Tax=Triparma retinervis TaxID=2557542 RepID=A0A9W7F995_9STRA|nr:hypothetical protein TrRE_jg13080 [Triparma retinervis]
MVTIRKAKGEDGDVGPSDYILYKSGGGSLKIYLFGAHITSYKVNGVEKTWMSTLSCLDGAKPMRGGVPIAFPQFADEGPLALHGFARESIWKVEGGAGEEGVVFVLEDDEKTRKLWQHSFRLEYRVKLNEEGDELDLSLKVVNKGSSPFTFGGCLHTYFAMDAMDTKISGLGGCEFIDKCDSRSVKKQDDEKITIPEEAHRSAKDAGKQEEMGFVDRVYLNTGSPKEFEISVASSGAPIFKVLHNGFPDTTLYNPYTGDKQGPGFPDFDDEGYKKIICLEPTIGEANRVVLEGGGEWEGGQRVKVM